MINKFSSIFWGTIFFALSLSGCNTILITHTQGEATDVVDSAASLDAKVDAKIDPEIQILPKPLTTLPLVDI